MNAIINAKILKGLRKMENIDDKIKSKMIQYQQLKKLYELTSMMFEDTNRYLYSPNYGESKVDDFLRTTGYRCLNEAYESLKRKVDEYWKQGKGIEEELVELYIEKNPKIVKSQSVIKKVKDINFPSRVINLLELIDTYPQLLDYESNLVRLIRFIDYVPNFLYIHQLKKISFNILIDEQLEYYLNPMVLEGMMALLESDILLSNSDFKSFLLEKIQGMNAYNYHFQHSDVLEMERIMHLNPKFDKELLFLWGLCPRSWQEWTSKDIRDRYLRENIGNERLIKDLIELSKLAKKESLKAWALNDIIKTYNDKEEFCFEREDSEEFKMEIAVLLNLGNSSIREHYIQLRKHYERVLDIEMAQILKDKRVRSAMLGVDTTQSQDIVVEFLRQREIQEDILGRKSVYCKFLLENGNSHLPFDGRCSYFFQELESNPCFRLESTQEQMKQLIDYFDSINGEYIYFYDNQSEFQKTPITFYKQFLHNIFFGGYLEQCFLKEEGNPDFCNEGIIDSFIEDNVIDVARQVIEFGKERNKNYNIEEEIIWNELYSQAVQYQKQLVNRSDSRNYLVKGSYEHH